MIKSEIITYGGWKRCLRIFNDTLELIVTLEVGPRIIRCGFVGEANLFVEYPDQTGKTGDDIYHSYGGHRLWIAPEEKPKTYFPDNRPVEWKRDGEWFHFLPPPEPTGFQKEIHVWLDPERALVRVLHRITNVSPSALNASIWALSVMGPGGRAVLPHEPFRPHSDYLLPVRPLVLWAYTDMSDPRWTWGKRFIQLAQRPVDSPQKIGAFNSPGWAAYFNNGTVFVKKFPAIPNESYPDFGCNCEVFTNHRMLEIESLGPLCSLHPGETLTHEEQWIVAKVDPREYSEKDLHALLKPFTG